MLYNLFMCTLSVAFLEMFNKNVFIFFKMSNSSLLSSIGSLFWSLVHLLKLSQQLGSSSKKQGVCVGITFIADLYAQKVFHCWVCLGPLFDWPGEGLHPILCSIDLQFNKSSSVVLVIWPAFTKSLELIWVR